MRFNTAFKNVLRVKKMSQNRLAQMMPSPKEDKEHMSSAAIASMLKKDNPSINALLPFLDKLGYDIVLVPTGNDALLPNDSFVIDGRDE